MRYSEDEDIREELLCCPDLPGRTTNSDVLNARNDYFQAQGLDWSKCVGVRTDGAASMRLDDARE